MDNETESSKWGHHLDRTAQAVMFLLCKRGRKFDRWFSCRMACVCWSGLLAGQTHSGCFLFLSLLPAASLLCFIPRSLCGFVYVHGYGMYTQTWTSHWQSKRCLKQQTKEIFKKNLPSTKNEENKKTPRTQNLPKLSKFRFLVLLGLFLCFIVDSVFWFFFFFLTREEKKKQEGCRGIGTSCRRVPAQYPAGCASYLRGESKFVPRR
jgi:hypothetical protein